MTVIDNHKQCVIRACRNQSETVMRNSKIYHSSVVATRVQKFDSLQLCFVH